MRTVTEGLEAYDAFSTGRAIAEFVDELSNWYVRRSRRRFWKSEEDTDKVAAYLTLYECLEMLSKLLAPYMPFMAEELHRNLVGERWSDAPESVHLSDWPVADEALIDQDLNFRMGVARRVVNMGRAARNASQLKTRQPLAAAVVAAGEREWAALAGLADVVCEELNVKALQGAGSAGELGRSRGLEQVGFWKKILEHPAYDAFWRDQAVDKILAAQPLSVPVMLVHGLWDQEDIYGAIAVYKAIEPKDTANDKVFLVMGPWYHGQMIADGSALGAIRFDSDTALYFRQHILRLVHAQQQ